ncbi:MAG: Uma2 family endonuclease [Calothrix sp. FI2-JRJ7]|jgi:Uma2 family endonuclease|nr:Uma2 family endonuclease [Calothrix sp. FI2-JRJ7]
MVISFQQQETIIYPPATSLEEFFNHPLKNAEWVDGKIIEKVGMTLLHSKIQARVSYYWRSYMLSSGQGGEVYTEALCRTNKQGRRPDVSYLDKHLLSQYGNADFLPQSFPLIAEIASADDSAEYLFAKAKQYLDSGCLEVWLIYPENQWIIILTKDKHLLLTLGETATTQVFLQGFSIAVTDLFS